MEIGSVGGCPWYEWVALADWLLVLPLVSSYDVYDVVVVSNDIWLDSRSPFRL